MDSKVVNAESKIRNLIQQHDVEWLIVCGLKSVSYNEMLKILQLLRKEELYELEAMMIWKMEFLELAQKEETNP